MADQIYFRDRIKNLEDLLKRFPNRTLNSSLHLDSTENHLKYLPVELQLIAANNDFNQTKEKITRLNDRLAQISLVRQFLVEATQTIEAQRNGILLVKSLLSIDAKLRNNLPAGDFKSQLALDQLRSQLVMIESRFAYNLQQSTAPTPKKTGMLKVTASGSVIAGFLMLAFLLGRKLYRVISEQKHTMPIN